MTVEDYPDADDVNRMFQEAADDDYVELTEEDRVKMLDAFSGEDVLKAAFRRLKSMPDLLLDALVEIPEAERAAEMAKFPRWMEVVKRSVPLSRELGSFIDEMTAAFDAEVAPNLQGDDE